MRSFLSMAQEVDFRPFLPVNPLVECTFEALAA